MTCPHCLSTSISKRQHRTSLGYRTFSCRACRLRFNQRTGSPFNDLQFPTDVVLLAVLWRLRYKLGFREVAELLLQRGFEVSHETIRNWEFRFAPQPQERSVKMAIEDRNLTVGTRLVANYRKQAHACMVEKRDEGGGILFVLGDGRKFKSASSAASALMGGKAVNGWRFWFHHRRLGVWSARCTKRRTPPESSATPPHPPTTASPD